MSTENIHSVSLEMVSTNNHHFQFQYVGPPEMSRENALQLILSQRVLAPSTEARARKALYPTQEDRAKDMTKSIIARVWAVIENNELDCMICMEKKPQMLTTKCGHITCHECWGQFVHMNHPDYHMECPMCRRFLWVDGVVELEVFTKVHGKVAQAGNSETEDGTEMKSLLD